jgi:hypothetical protein
MRKSIVAAIAFGAVTLSSTAALAVGLFGSPDQPWCIVYTGDDARLCDYPSYASCMATASGNVGYCLPNPAFFSSNQQAWGEAYGNPYSLPQAPPPRPRRHRGY